MRDYRKLLKTGVFGVTDKGEEFVVVGDLFVYQDGDYDCVSKLTEDLCFSYRKVEKLVECKSFKGMRNIINGTSSCGSIIYDRNREETVEMTVAEIEAKLGIKNLKIVKEGK